jgi:hypothetical protein
MVQLICLLPGYPNSNPATSRIKIIDLQAELHGGNSDTLLSVLKIANGIFAKLIRYRQNLLNKLIIWTE